MRGRVKGTGEIHLSFQAEGGVDGAAAETANGREAADEGRGADGASELGRNMAGAGAGAHADAVVGGKDYSQARATKA